ncbi:MAG TPA: hypothetical protein VI248_24145 [Kineosporiaceae bacterium]
METADTARGVSGGAAALSSGPRPLLDTEISLSPGQGADLDSSNAAAVKAVGPDGPIDIYFGAGLIRVNGGDLFYSSSQALPTAEGCQTTLEHSPHTAEASASPASQYCFVTSKRRVAWMRINDEHSSPTGTVVVLTLRVW